MSVRHLCQESISHTENSKHTCSCRHMLQISVQLCPSVETPPLALSLSLHLLQNCPTYFQVTPHHSSIISVIPHSTLCSFARPRSSSAQRLCVPHVSSVFGSRGFRSAGPAIWNSLPLSVTAPPFILSRNSSRRTYLPQPSPLIELSSMRL